MTKNHPIISPLRNLAARFLQSTAPDGEEKKIAPSEESLSYPVVPRWSNRQIGFFDSGYRQDIDKIIAKHGRGQKSFYWDMVDSDPELSSLIDTRITNVTALDWWIEPADESEPEKEIAAIVRKALTKFNFNGAMEEMLGAFVTGASFAEVDWKLAKVNGREMWIPSEMRDIPADYFERVRGAWYLKPSPELNRYQDIVESMKQRTGDKYSGSSGIPISEFPYRFIVHAFQDRGDKKSGVSLLRSLYYIWKFKHDGLVYWMKAAEEWSRDKVALNSPNKDFDKEYDAAVKELQKFVKTGLLVLPEGWESKLLSGSIDPRFADILKKSLDSSMRFRILGSTLSAGTDETGSRSLGEVHAEKEQERKESDAKGLMESLNQTLIRWIVKLNLDDPTVEREDYPAFRIDYELPKDSAITRENLKVAREFGVPMTLQYVAGELGVEIAPDDTPEEDLVPPMPVAPNPFAFPSGDSREIEDEGADEDKLADLMHRTSHLYAGIHVHSLASVRKRSEQSQRLRDNLEQGAVDAGIPVFDEFKAQIAKWLKKFDTAESALDKFESLKLKTKNFENQIAITFFWSLLNGMDFVYNLPEVKKDLRRKPSDASPMNLQDEWDPVPFQEAIDQFRSKVPLTIKQFNALKSYAKRWALTARGLSVDAIQRELRSALDRAIASGTTLETFLDDLADGNVAVTHRHGETIFRTNVQTAYNTAQAEAMFDPEIADAIPAFRFDAIIDERTTDICEDREGKIFRREDLQVLEIVPPLHYNCRSTVVPLFADEFDSSMLSKAPSVPAAEGFGLFKSILF